MSRENYPRGGLTGLCPTGKRAHPTRAEAKDHARRLKLKTNSHTRPYLCATCGYWHVGHMPEDVLRGRRTAGEIYKPRKDGAA